MDPAIQVQGPRLLKESQYAIYATVCATLVQTIAQLTDSSEEKKIRLGISLGASILNVVAALWAFSLTGDIQHNDWKIIIYKVIFFSTGILSPYAAISLLLPEWLTWYVFLIICTILIIYKTYNVLISISKWSYKKVVLAKEYVLENFSKLIRKDQVPRNAVVAAPPPSHV